MFTTNMTLILVNKLKKRGNIWDMNQNILIHRHGKKVCDIEKHYELLTIEFNSVPPIMNQKEKDLAMKTSQTSLFVTLDVTSGSGEDVPVPIDFDKKNPTLNNSVSKASMNPKNSKPDWSNDVPNNPEMINQKAHLMKTANSPKKRRLRCKKRCKKKRFKNSKKWAECEQKVDFRL